MKKKIWIIIGVAALILLFIGANVFRAMNKEELTVKTTQLKNQEIIGNVMIPGSLKFADEEYFYNESEKGKVGEILVKEGDKVTKGTTVIRYENDQLYLEKEQNALSIESQNLKISQLKKQLSDLAKKEKDLKKEVGDKEAKKTIDPERDQLKLEQKMADIEARQLKIQRQTIEKQIAELAVKSEIDGTVLTVDQQSASAVSQTPKPIVHLGNVGKLVIEGVISEYDSLKVKEGQSVTIRSDVIPDKEWTGKVTYVSVIPEGNEAAMGGMDDAAVQYPIEITLDSAEMEARPGFKLIMEIETDKRTVDAIPSEAVKQDGEDYYVFTVEDGKAVRKNIKVGVTSGELMEVKEGIEKKDKVILSPSDTLQAGTDVKVK
ncbi:efflux RND transporter periplasmic adaptor subunit [Metabacillus fastidiosus]|uniref:efflux RND transporter periplasmic adaptor subunit n=1 Tax=Metabacillus fastidiosus TaxID=1458 RepID=UPI002E1A2A96|nr:efflux RND transporter periplasmic adaptor subunit [Metabacillus fastidiosus]